MLFNSFHFVVFFPLITLLYYLFPLRQRIWLLLLASCYFYMCFIPEYVLILLVTILIDYGMAIKIEKALTERARFAYLWISILSTVAVLGLFKYFNFFVQNYNVVADALGWSRSLTLSLILPIGLSFHTFQSLSYVIEVYRRKQPAETDFVLYSLYVMYYPQLVAGPIERPQNILPQLHQRHNFDYANVTAGLRLMLWGYFKKIAVADQLAPLANELFKNSDQYYGAAVWLGVACFTLQIYGDFSGYSDIAIGSSRVMGIRLMTNFRRPYLSSSISEFWSRWHISLSTWFRDYVYIPLGGKRVPPFRRACNIAAVFLLSGFWHGANWTFIVWGAIHFLLTFLEAQAGLHQPASSLQKALGWARTIFFVSLAWVFFRADSLAQAFTILRNACQVNLSSAVHLVAIVEQGWQSVVLGGSCALVLFLMDKWHHENEDINEKWVGLSLHQRWSLYYFLTAAVAMGKFGHGQFIYFQF